MKIAFDVMGTLSGKDQNKVLHLFRTLEHMGHTMFVWSNSIQYAFDIVSQLKLAVPAERVLYKYSTFDVKKEEGLDIMDIAVEDDTSQTYLATKKFVFVHEIPEINTDEFVLLVHNLTSKK